jgi:ABC-type glycerol-3-phosphate transport system substrate-binding protein
MTYRLHLARLPVLLFLSIFLGMVLAGCKENTEIPWATVRATNTGSTPAPADAPAPILPETVTPAITLTARPIIPPGLKGQKIEFWHPWQGDLAKRVEDAATEFNRTNEWGLMVKVRPFYSGGALDEAIAAGLKDPASGLPQAVAAPGDQLAAWSAKPNGLVGLDELINHPQLGMSEEDIKAYYPVFWAQDQVGGKRVGIPALRTARVIFYNESWAKELGFSSPPKSPEEFKKQACAAAQKNNTSGYIDKYGTGGWLIDNDALTTLSWLGAFGAQPVPDADGMPYTFQSKEADAALAFLRGMLDDGCAWLSRRPEPYGYFSDRLALFYSGTLTDTYVQSRWQAKQKGKDSWRILPFTRVDGKTLVYSSGYSYAVFNSKQDTELAAWLFVRYLETPTVAVKLVEALPSLPVSSAIAAQLKNEQTNFPWDMLLPLTDQVRPAPALASWVAVHRVVEDAAWQVYHLPVETVPEILPQLDETIQEMMGR